MKLGFMRVISFTILLIFLFSSCKIADEKNLNVENREYIVKFEIWNQNIQYIYVLTPDDHILAQYKDSNSNFEEIDVALTQEQIANVEPYINQIRELTEKDIQGTADYAGDIWYVRFYLGDKKICFDYGASKNESVNILVDEILRCCRTTWTRQAKTFKGY